jgi:hypothetical protein
VLVRKLPELRNLPKLFKIVIYGEGSLIGQEDMIDKEFYTCSLRCMSQKGKLLCIKKSDFLAL